MKEKNKLMDDVAIRLIKEAKPIAPFLLLGALLDIAGVLCDVASPKMLGHLVQKLYDFWQAGVVGSIRGALLPGMGVLVLLYLAGSAFSYLNMCLMNTTVTRQFTCSLRIKISDKICRLPVRYVDQTPVGDILNRLIDDVSEVGGYVHQIFDTMVRGLSLIHI